MNRHQKLVEEWTDTMGIRRRGAQSGWGLRVWLIMEELLELTEALASSDEVEAVDAIADLLVVVYGTADWMSIDIEPYFAEVMRSNFTKTPGLTNGDGKLQKGPDYDPPRIAEMLAQGIGRIKRGGQ